MKKIFSYNGTDDVLLHKGDILIWQRQKFYKSLDGIEFWIEDKEVLPVVHLSLNERKDLVNKILANAIYDNNLFTTLIELIYETK